jgi:hypothetical protein
LQRQLRALVDRLAGANGARLGRHLRVGQRLDQQRDPAIEQLGQRAPAFGLIGELEQRGHRHAPHAAASRAREQQRRRVFVLRRRQAEQQLARRAHRQMLAASARLAALVADAKQLMVL